MEQTPLLRRALGAAWIAATVGALLGCPVTTVDLGSNLPTGPVDAGKEAEVDAEPVITSDCPFVTELEVQALRGVQCSSTCADGMGPARAVGSSAELIAVTAGQWLTCAGAPPWAADAVGLEFQAGCTLFLLHPAPDGGVVRGVDPDDQGTFDVVETRTGGSVARSIDFHFPFRRWEASVTTSDCPHGMRIDDGDGGVIDLAAIPSKTPPLD